MAIPDKIPSQLFKFKPIDKYCLSLLINNEIYYSHIDELNDPLDCPYHAITVNNKEDRKKLLYDFLTKQIPKLTIEKFENELLNTIADRCGKYTYNQIIDDEKLFATCFLNNTTKEVIRDNFRFFCLSATYSEPLLWAHYAAGHKGVCLEFDFSKEFKNSFIIVEYPLDYPKIEFSDFINNRNEQLRLFGTKYYRWSYEKEWRILNNADSKYEKYNPNCLTAVIFGIRTSEIDKQTIYSILKNRKIKFYDAKIREFSYIIDRIELNKREII